MFCVTSGRFLRYHIVPRLFFFTILLVSFGIRVYKIDSPLWSDEIFGYRLATLGLKEIIENSWNDQHPPMYYLIQWLIFNVGHSRSEITWRWLSLASGVLTICVIRNIARYMINWQMACVISCIAASLPSLVFYSQEARSYSILVFLASLSIWLTLSIMRNPTVGTLWIAWVITSLVGLCTGYSYVMILSVQVVFLGVLYYRREIWWFAVAVVSGVILLISPFAIYSLKKYAVKSAHAEPLSLWRTLQTLFAGEPLRYGFSMAHTVVPSLVIGLCLIAAVRAIRLGDKRLMYVIVQVVLPIVGFVVLSWLVKLVVPVYQARQFLVLLPAFLLLMASGMAECRRWLTVRKWRVVTMCVLVGTVGLNGMGLKSYWMLPKSPEGNAVLRIRRDLREGESVVSLHYALSYALGFYTHGILVYHSPKKVGESYRYELSDSEGLAYMRSKSEHFVGTQEIKASGRFWVVAHLRVHREPIASLVDGCRILERESFVAMNAAFEVMKVECP